MPALARGTIPDNRHRFQHWRPEPRRQTPRARALPRISCGISSPINAERIFALRVTKSSFSISSISVRLNSGRSCGKKQPLIFAQPPGYGLRKADLLVVIFQIVEFHLVFQYSCARRIQPANMNKTFLILQVVLTQPVGNALGGIRLVT